MRNLNLIILTALVVFSFQESEMKAQCPAECPDGGDETFDHSSNGAGDCNNSAQNGDCSIAIGSGNTIGTGADRSFVFGENLNQNNQESFLVGWNGDETFYLEDGKASLNTITTHSEVDLFLEEAGAGTTGDWGQNFGNNFPDFTGAGVKWAGSGESDPFIVTPLTGMGLRYQWTNYAANFGMIERSYNPDIKDAVIIIDDENATKTSSTSNILRVGFRWGDPAGTNGYDSLVHVYPRGNALGNIFEVYGAAGKPGGGSWSTLSDRKVKKNISPYKDGLEELLQIKPVRYQYNQKAGYNTDEEFVGVIAQDMQKVAPYMVNEEGKYLNYNSTALVYMLVNALQEEHKQLEEEKAKRKRLEKRVADLEEKYNAVFGSSDKGSTSLNPNISDNQEEVTLSNQSIEEPLLYQNRPNPFKGSTEIGYYLPESAKNAMIIITEIETGKVIKRVLLNEKGSGSLKVNVVELSAGAYSYTLVIDGNQSLSRQMILK